ncbi:hypothetical protein Pcinc_029442 [Petrolisthes cinctipes]|uniref:non-specific serine/threonine protein kinase n=1 Tax=Petrolisthes cinctipes TaxID=88211 RepID=A0AAE1K3X6_PETCI|nr:hypothetical protein Pcinc_029442 [Petrolisthes cinctipes]
MGPKLTDFEVLATIGSGSHGTVHKVRRRYDGQVLVWKELNYGAMTEVEKQGLVMEVNLLRELRHPNIVRFQHHIVDRRATTLYILMEYCPGGDLGRLVSRCRQTSTFLEEGFIWRVLSQICQALKVCHDRNLHHGRLVLHRDIKPANVFLDSEGRVKLGDFGLARTLNSEASFATTYAGTPYYMSPEVMQGRDYNERSDIWSLGCLVYELCALHPPFQASTHRDLAAKIREARYDSIPIQYSCQLKEMLALLLTYEDYLRPSALTVLHHASLVANTSGRSLMEEQKTKEEEALCRSLESSVLLRKYGNVNKCVDEDNVDDQKNMDFTKCRDVEEGKGGCKEDRQRRGSVDGEGSDVENEEKEENREEEFEREDDYNQEEYEAHGDQGESIDDLPIGEIGDNAKEDEDWAIKFKEEFTKQAKSRLKESPAITVSPMTETFRVPRREDIEAPNSEISPDLPGLAHLRYKSDAEEESEEIRQKKDRTERLDHGDQERRAREWPENGGGRGRRSREWPRRSNSMDPERRTRDQVKRSDSIGREKRSRVRHDSIESCLGETVERICHTARVREVVGRLECACGGISTSSWRERLVALREAEVGVREREVAVKEREREVREREHRVTAMEREARQHLVRAQIYLRQSRPRQNAATSPHRPESDLDTTVSADPGDERIKTISRPDPQKINNPFLEMRGIQPQPEKHVSFRERTDRFKSNTLDNPKSRWKRGNIFGLVEGKKEAREKVNDDIKDKDTTKPGTLVTEDTNQQPRPPHTSDLPRNPPPQASEQPRLRKRQGSVETLIRRRNNTGDDKENQVQGPRHKPVPELKGKLLGTHAGLKVGSKQVKGRLPVRNTRARVLQFYNVV